MSLKEDILECLIKENKFCSNHEISLAINKNGSEVSKIIYTLKQASYVQVNHSKSVKITDKGKNYYALNYDDIQHDPDALVDPEPQEHDKEMIEKDNKPTLSWDALYTARKQDTNPALSVSALQQQVEQIKSDKNKPAHKLENHDVAIGLLGELSKIHGGDVGIALNQIKEFIQDCHK